jgi:predicted permease
MLQDVQYAWRALRRSPGFAAVAVLSLALGIGAAAALFSLVDAVLLKPLTYREPDRLVFVREVVPPLAHVYPTLPVNYQHLRFWRQEARSFDSLAAFLSRNSSLGGSEPAPVGGVVATANLFQVLGVDMQLGRGFTPEDAQRGHDDKVVITDSLWRGRFNASPALIGHSILLAGVPHTVVGVLPASFRFPKDDDLGALSHLNPTIDIFRPMAQPMSDGWGGDYDYLVIGRLRRGVSGAQGAAELDTLEARIAAEHSLAKGLHVQSRALQEVIASPVRASLLVLLSAVLMLLLIVCVNLANLMLTRSSARARDFGLRIALGASRSRVARAALLEALLLSIAGGVLGVAAARAAVAAFVATSPVRLPRLDEVQVDGPVTLFVFGLTVLCGLLFGLLPSLRLAAADPQQLLRASSYTASEGRHGLRLREILVGGEVALSTLLLVLAGLLVSSLWSVLRVDRGFAADAAVAIDVYPVGAAYRSKDAQAAFYDRAVERIRALPGVRSAAAVSHAPLTGESNVNSVQLEGMDTTVDPVTRQAVMVNVRFVGADYFSTLSIPLVRGRGIEEGDRNRNVAVISARLAAKLWPDKNPLGWKIRNAGSGVRGAEIVGVVGDVHTTRLDKDPTMMIYVPFWPSPFQVTEIVVRAAAADPRTVMPALRRALRDVDPSAPIRTMRTMNEIVSETVAQRRFQMRVSAAFGLSALLLAALGIYGVVAYGVTLRRREIGIRLALGARESQVTRQMTSEGIRPVAAGLVVGLVTALAAGGLVRTVLFGVTPTDPFTLGTVVLVLGLVGALACFAPAWSATRIDPARVLREQ